MCWQILLLVTKIKNEISYLILILYKSQIIHIMNIERDNHVFKFPATTSGLSKFPTKIRNIVYQNPLKKYLNVTTLFSTNLDVITFAFSSYLVKHRYTVPNTNQRSKNWVKKETQTPVGSFYLTYVNY